MKKTYYRWTLPLTGVVLIGTAVSAEQNKSTYLNSTNRLTLSLRFGLNISTKFTGVAGGFAAGSPAGGGRLTPNGDAYNYDDGYVLTDSTGNFLNLTTYWGYDNTATQYDPVANTIAFNRTTAAGASSGQSDDSKPYPGFEITYNRELGVTQDGHEIHFGIEGAVNYLKISFNDSSSSPLTRVATFYQLPVGVTPPAATPGTPFQGTFDGSPGGYALIGVPPIGTTTTLIPGGLLSQDKFDGDLLGFRLGPYIDFPLSEKWGLHLSGGLAFGLLYDHASWQQSFALAGGGTATASGSGSDFDTLLGYYISLSATYQFNEDWGIEGGVQFQDIGKYSHNFSGRTAELDLSRSLFVQVGISYSF